MNGETRILAGHVALALERHIAALADCPDLPCPEALRELAELARLINKSGQMDAERGTDEGVDVAGLHAGRDEEPLFYTRRGLKKKCGLSVATIGRRIDDGLLAETPLGIPAAEVKRYADMKGSKCDI